MEDRLKELRDRIDQLDDEILRLLNRRAQLAQEIGRLKDGSVYRPEREAQILQRLAASNDGPLSGETIGRLFAEIMSACRALEQPVAVAYLGPQGTYSEEAALRRFGSAARAVPCASIDEVFREVEAGVVGYGLVPVENSTEGAIGRTLDLLLATSLKVCGEVQLPIHHALLSRALDLNAVRRVYSHPQSLGQCHEWLGQNLTHATRVQAASNAEAARLASQEEGAAAIASGKAGEMFRLPALAENIEDDPRNTTRFLVIGDQEVAPSGRDKTSLVMSAKNRPGAVHELLAPFAQCGVSMTRLESRPSRTGLWEYVFFVDIEGHQRDEQVARALAEMRERAAFLKVLGSYPAA
ncbi:MAG TPA: prephenate dehydratase [Burkholderiales bacterium]|nr:prephenate dehydratase [Burkholderiales bacterium]